MKVENPAIFREIRTLAKKDPIMAAGGNTINYASLDKYLALRSARMLALEGIFDRVGEGKKSPKKAAAPPATAGAAGKEAEEDVKGKLGQIRNAPVLVFDADYTLWHGSRADHERLRAIAKDLHSSLPEGTAKLEQIESRVMSLYYYFGDSKALVAAFVGLGGKLNPDIMAQLRGSFEGIKENFEEYLGMAELVRELAKQGRKIGILSDAPKQLLEQRRLKSTFGGSIPSTAAISTIKEFSVKPDVFMLTKIMDKLGKRSKYDVVFIGDDIVKDVGGPQRHGYSSVLTYHGFDSGYHYRIEREQAMDKGSFCALPPALETHSVEALKAIFV